jgi:hypothetical protein
MSANIVISVQIWGYFMEIRFGTHSLRLPHPRPLSLKKGEG